MNIIEVLEQEQLRSDIPEFKAGDTVKVYCKIIEGTRERIQLFEGVVISRSGSGVRENFTVRRISYGVGVDFWSVFYANFGQNHAARTRGT